MCLCPSQNVPHVLSPVLWKAYPIRSELLCVTGIYSLRFGSELDVKYLHRIQIGGRGAVPFSF